MPSDKFKLFMDSAAKSKKEIEAEVQRLVKKRIQGMVKDIVKDAVESVAEAILPTGGEKIPPRKEPVSYQSAKKQQTIHEDEIAYSADPYNDNPLTDTIRRMRELGQTMYNGTMLRRCVEQSIVKQGEFVKDITDDFPRNAFCAIDKPVYGALSTDQLRTYFTWRTDVRRGQYRTVDKPYVVLYCFELLNKIGVLSAEDALLRLIALWENCREFCPYLDRVMPHWLKDFYAYNCFDKEYNYYGRLFPIGAFSGEHSDNDTAELLQGNYKNKLKYLDDCSTYSIKRSIFYKEENIPQLFDEATEAVLTALDRYFAERDISLFEVLCGRPKKDFSWSPFSGAYVNLDRMDGFMPCRIGSMERYCIKRGEPALERFEYAPYRSFIGYVIKATESALRKRAGFRYGISANLSSVLEDFINRDKLFKAATEPAFAEVIPNAVTRFCDSKGIHPKKKERKKKKSVLEEEYYSPEYGSPYPPQDFEVNPERLTEIRRQSDEIAKKLIIEEEPENAPDIEEITELTAQIENDVFEERTELAYQDVRETSAQYDFSALPSEWRQLGESLDKSTMEILLAVSNGTAEIYCRQNGILPEAAYEQVNALALECIGDVIIENNGFIEDYLNEINGLISAIE